MAEKHAASPQGEDPRRTLPQVHRVVADERLCDLVECFSRRVVLCAAQEVLGRYRRSLKAGTAVPSCDEVVNAVRSEVLRQELDRLRPVVNATGVVLHTGLGRAVLPQRAVDALSGLNRCCNMQIDLATGKRGKRSDTTERLLCMITGAEAAFVVNNNAAATFLIFSVLCRGREVVVSRGQLIEIGGSYRLPDCIRASGALIREVGTTNRTHLRDYERAIGEGTAAVLHVNPSNYRIVGFTRSVPLKDLVQLKEKHRVLVIDDMGCGCLVDMTQYGLPPEPTVQESVRAGADLVCFSGDKLIGGAQAGIIVGRKELVGELRAHPLARILRVCKLTDLVLQETLRLFLDPDSVSHTNPTIGMLVVEKERLRVRARRLQRHITGMGLPLQCEVQESESAVGGGSMPALSLPTYVVAVRSRGLTAQQLAAALRRHEPPVVARIADDQVLLDVRTLLGGQERIVCEALRRIAAQRQA